MKKIVAIGRGGVGKSSFIALMAKYLKASKECSILLIDADPDENLADLVGLDLDKLKINTISDVLFDVRYDNINERLKSFSLPERIEFLVNQKALYEGEDFDLLSIGTKWTQGCYCQPNNILKGLIKALEKNYDYILIDSPAGLEHINRRITSSFDDIFEILDPTQKAFGHLERVYRILSEIKISFRNFYLLGNFKFSDELIKMIDKQTGYKYIGKLEYDQSVEEFNLQGKSLLKLNQDSPMFVSIRNIAAAVGY
ncbi:MAG: AAA family ATPase [Candidatus Omnitrophota bacterium]|jgi:CO dehydrogenase maturation factor